MQTNRRLEIFQLSVIGAMFVASALAWSHVPERMPVHWNLRGEPDRYGGKLEGLLATPAIAIWLYGLLLLLPKIDPRRTSYEAFARPYAIVRVTTVGLLAGVHAVLLLVALGYRVNVGFMVPLGVGLLLCILGNFMGKFRPNWFVGVRTPWTLSSNLSWSKTNRLGGRMFVATGLALLLYAFVHNAWMLAIVMALTAGMVVWLPVYSYLVWRRDTERTHAAGSRSAQ